MRSHRDMKVKRSNTTNLQTELEAEMHCMEVQARGLRSKPLLCFTSLCFAFLISGARIGTGRKYFRPCMKPSWLQLSPNRKRSS